VSAPSNTAVRNFDCSIGIRFYMIYIIYPSVPRMSRPVLKCTHSVLDGWSRR